jgi:hypothetical protein
MRRTQVTLKFIRFWRDLIFDVLHQISSVTLPLLATQ